MPSQKAILGGLALGAFVAAMVYGGIAKMQQASKPTQILVAHMDAPQRPAATDPSCSWVHKTSGALSAWTQDCITPHGQWHVRPTATPVGFALEVGSQTGGQIAAVFDLPADAQIADWAPALRTMAQIPDGCAFAPSSQPVGQGQSAFELVPVGAHKEAYDALPSDEVPEPPCGPYGISADGQRLFVQNKDAPAQLVFVDLGQDMAMVDVASIRIAAAK